MSKFFELKRRLFSAFLGAAVIISSIMWSEWSYFLIFFIICTGAQWEFYRLVRIQDYLPLRFFGVFIGGFLFVLTFFIERGDLDGKYLFLMFPLASIIFIFKLYKRKDQNPFVNIALYYLGITYVALPFSLVNVIVFDGGKYAYKILLGLMLIIWSSDTGAVIVVVAGTYGDLVESHFKRTMSIKDSGNVIPGHGGFLDRFDSLILTVPFIVIFLKLL